ncbi:MarR family transcriptional regulator [Oscillospiraceae bacterium NTUH-002-81]|nr:MarR family transcriptional regulator [Oscillospiraceae bacterium NTUH-002-81]
MDISTIKALLDACYQAKRVRELLPALPNGVSSSHIQYLDIIEQLENRGMKVKISDISDTLHLPRPGVTRTVKEMEDKGFLKKTTSDADGRITYLSITEAGKKLSQTYNDRFFSQLAPLLTDISQEEASCTIRTIEKLYQVMAERRISLE